MKAVAKKCEQDYTEKQERHDMKNKQSLKLHQAQHQRQAFSPARGRFVETLTKKPAGAERTASFFDCGQSFSAHRQ